ncbi:hypothetical protein E8E13_004269 [Curvularia kusanoi]|uniref:Uncharacterized protein n=1 Tax=Curvularia kusanoi TaxID=90978 RepID=A0A9P4TCK3_CURKU|nr:hypothetical protein E8E13_004269 [Curvularia kusanoi]
MRAYSPALRPHDIDEREFVAFIDNLTVAQAPPAPLQVLNVAGSAVGTVPHHWAMAAGSMLAEKNLEHGIISIRDRCMYALQPYVADLSFNVPPPSGERNILDRIAAKSIEKKRKKQEEKSRKNDGYSSDSSSSSSSSSDSDSEDDKSQRKIARRVRKINREAEKDLRRHPDRAAQIEEDRARKVFQAENKPSRDSGKEERKRKKKQSKRLEKSNKRQSKDLEKVRKLEFIVVEDMSKQHSAT